METLETETVVVGAGVVGLACAAALAKAGQEVLVLERNARFGEETSARNSEVIHAGIYYPPGSLKARLCVRGKALMYGYCHDRHILHQRLGKLIVAADEQDKQTLSGLLSKGKRNGVDDLRWLDRHEMLDFEPRVAGIGALYSPSTGIVDSHSLMLNLSGDLESRGGAVSYRSTVTALHSTSNKFRIEVMTDRETASISCQRLVNCAGLQAVQLAATDPASTGMALPQPFYTKGNYFRLTAKVPFRRLIYPAPVLGGLGVHLTMGLDGTARFGPDVEPVSAPTVDLEVQQIRSDSFYQSIRRYWPELPDDSLQPDYAGIRPKIRWPQRPGEAVADFAVLGPKQHGIDRLVHCLGIESPGLTASLAIAEMVASL